MLARSFATLRSVSSAVAGRNAVDIFIYYYRASVAPLVAYFVVDTAYVRVSR